MEVNNLRLQWAGHVAEVGRQEIYTKSGTETSWKTEKEI
jgi:hypothetical protein